MASFEHSPYLLWVIILITLWTIPWKALALWRSARRGQIGWFIFFVLINTASIMEIIYLKVFGNLKPKNLERRKRRLRDFH